MFFASGTASMHNNAYLFTVLAMATAVGAWPDMSLGLERQWRIAVSAENSSKAKVGDRVCLTEIIFYGNPSCEGPPLHSSAEQTVGEANWRAIFSNPNEAVNSPDAAMSVFNGIVNPRGGLFCFELAMQSADWSSSLSFTSHTWIGINFTDAVEVRCARVHGDFVRVNDEARSWKDIGPLQLALTNSPAGGAHDGRVAQWSLQPSFEQLESGTSIRTWVQLPIGHVPYMFPSQCLIRTDVKMGVPPDEACCTWPLPPSLITPVPAMFESTHGHGLPNWTANRTYCAPGGSVRPGHPCAFGCKHALSRWDSTAVDAVWSLAECSDEGTKLPLDDFVVELTSCPAFWHTPLDTSNNNGERKEMGVFVVAPVDESLAGSSTSVDALTQQPPKEGPGSIIPTVILPLLLGFVLMMGCAASIFFCKRCRRPSKSLGSEKASIASPDVVLGAAMHDVSTQACPKSESQV